MPLPAAVTTAAKNIVQSDAAREIAASVATSVATGVSQKLLQRFDEGRPTARNAQAGGAGEHALAPRRNTLPAASPRGSTGPTTSQPAAEGAGTAQTSGRLSGPHGELPPPSCAEALAHGPVRSATPVHLSDPVDRHVTPADAGTAEAGSQSRAAHADDLPLMNGQGESVGTKNAPDAAQAHVGPAPTSAAPVSLRPDTRTTSPGQASGNAAVADGPSLREAFKHKLRTLFG